MCRLILCRPYQYAPRCRQSARSTTCSVFNNAHLPPRRCSILRVLIRGAPTPVRRWTCRTGVEGSHTMHTREYYLQCASDARRGAKPAYVVGAGLYNRIAQQFEIMAASAGAMTKLVGNLKPKV